MRAGLITALALALSGCRTPAAVGPRAGVVGLTVMIDQPLDGGPGQAQVDDRRWLALPAAGTVDLGGVAADLELDSLLLESITRAGSLRVLGCAVLDHAEALTSGWIVGREVAITTVDGAEVTGTVVELGAQVAVVTVDDQQLEVPLADVTPVTAADATAAAVPAIGSPVTIDTLAGPQVAAMQGLSVDSLVVHDAAGLRHAIRADAIARLRVPELAAAPTLRCRITTSYPGVQAIRLAYRTTTVRWQAAYQVAITDDAPASITLVPRYTIDLAGLPAPAVDTLPADVSLRSVASGDATTPLTVWHGAVALGGAAATVLGPPSTRAARLRRWYRGAAPSEDGVDPHERSWGQASTGQVWRELVFARAATDVPGELRVGSPDGHGGTRWSTGALPAAPEPGPEVTLVRVPLDVDPDLIGFRERLVHDDDDGLADEVRLSVANRGPAPVKVILEEPLRPIGRPTVRFAAPAPGTLSAEVWQLEVEIAPSGLERAAVLLQYPDEP